MPGMIIIAIVGALIAFSSGASGFAAYSGAASAFHQIYAAVLMLTSVVGLLISAVAMAPL